MDAGRQQQPCDGDAGPDHVGRAASAYGRERQHEQEERLRAAARRERKGRRLKFVLLGVFRSYDSIIEREWLKRMASACPEVFELHLNLKFKPKDADDVPRNVSVGRLTPQRLFGLLPERNLHSVVVCGNHRFRDGVRGMLVKGGVPKNIVTLL